MALTTTMTLGNIPLPTAYSKITGVNIRESGSNETGKLYSVELLVNDFTDDTKEYSFQQRNFQFNDVQVTTFTVGGMYDLLKTKEEFSESIDL